MLGVISPRLSCQRLRGQNTSVGIGLIEIIERYVILNYKTSFDIAFYKLFYTYFCLYLAQNYLFTKQLYFTFASFGLGCHSMLQH